MKRSEMLNSISVLIHEHRRRTEAITSDELAELILEKIENAGMIPPDYFIDGYDDMFDEPVKIRRSGGWGPE